MLDSGHISKRELSGFAGGLDVEYERGQSQ